MRRWLPLLFVFAVSGPRASADAVDDFVREELKKQNIPGLSIAVVKNGEVVKAEGYGLANVELSVPATKDTIYSSGSVGKQFTAAVVMLLMEDGKLSLDDPIGKHLGVTPEAWKDITVRHMLTHTSGIKDITNSLNLRKDYSDSELVELAAKQKLDFPPGDQWRYSNTGYVLLGIIIKNASGKFYGDILKERVFGPLGMDTARVHDEADIIPHRAAGYRLAGGKIKNQQYVSPTLNKTADGSLVLSVMDMAKWDAGLYTEKFLKKASLEQLWTPVRLNNGRTFSYGFGWAISSRRGHKEIEHGGAWLGFQTHISRFVDDKLAIMVLTNRVGCDPAKVAHGIAGFFEPTLKPVSMLTPEIDPDPKRTESFLALLKDLAEGKPDSPLTAETFRADIEKRSEDEKRRSMAALRDIRSLTYITCDDVSRRHLERHGTRISRLYHYRSEGGRRPAYVTFYVTVDGKVADVGAKSH